VDPQIRKLFRDVMFKTLLQCDEKKAWDAFRLVSTNFLVNIRAEIYKELMEDMLSLYHKLCCNMSLRIHVFISTWISSPTTAAWFVMSTVKFSWGNCKDRETISGKVVHVHVGWLLLDARQICSWAAKQATGKAKSQFEADFYRYMSDVHIS